MELTLIQKESLVSLIYTELISFEEIGLGEIGDCHDAAERIVKKWAKKNNIKLP